MGIGGGRGGELVDCWVGGELPAAVVGWHHPVHADCLTDRRPTGRAHHANHVCPEVPEEQQVPSQVTQRLAGQAHHHARADLGRRAGERHTVSGGGRRRRGEAAA